MRSGSAGVKGGRLREIRPPFVVAAPRGARVRTRLRVSAQDAAVLEALGSYLGRLAGRDLEVNLPEPLAHLGNAPGGRYRLTSEVDFPHRGGDVAAQAETGAVRYDITFDPAKGRWYLDASWKVSPGPPPALEALRRQPVLAVDLNHGHLAVWVVLPDGNPAGPAVTVPLDLDGLPATQRDGRLRHAITELIRLAQQHGCGAVAVEDLNFERARAGGRERNGSRPSRGKRGRAFRRIVAGLPTGQFRDRLAQMTFSQGIAVIAVDPAYTSRWGAEHWLAPLQDKDQVATGHHAAAVTIGRRAHGHKARRRAGVTGTVRRNGTRRATPRAPQARHANRDDRPRQAPRQPPDRWRKTGQATRDHPPPQAPDDRSRAPAEPIVTIAQCLGTVLRQERRLVGEGAARRGGRIRGRRDAALPARRPR